MQWSDPNPNRDVLLNKRLPKWPQMRVTGIPVTEDQALEIIRRTDLFFVCGRFKSDDDDSFAGKVADIVGMPKQEDNDDYWERLKKWQKDWGLILTEYVRNDLISSSYVCGANGWCHPDGTIGFAENVGKWPSVADVLDDWAKLAIEFPFLDLVATLYSGEQCEENTEPIVSIVVKDGDADLAYPSDDLLKRFPPVPDPLKLMENLEDFDNRRSALSLDLIKRWKR